MNKRNIIRLILISVLMACTGHNAFERSLSVADSLMHEQPDSAYRLLCAMEQDAARMPEALQMRRLLLLSNAQNKAYKSFASDSIGTLLTEYYDRNGKANERMLAYYIKGCTYRDLGDQPAALNCFNQAIDAADTSLADCDFRQLCIVHAQIAGIFRKRGLPDEALLAYEKAEQFALMSKDTLSLLNIAANKSNVMLNKGLIDEALAIKEKIAALYLEKGYPQKAAQTRVQLIKWYARKGDFSKARAAMDNYEAHSGHFTADGHVKAGKEDYYHIKGTFYLEKGDTDSAAHYFRLLRQKGKTLNNQYLASWGLTRLYRKLQDNDSLAKYALGTFLLSDSLFNQQAAQNMQNAQAMYNYARHQETAHRKEQEARTARLHLRYGMATGTLCAIVLLMLILSLRKRAKQKEREANMLKVELRGTICALQNAKEELEKLALEKLETEKPQPEPAIEQKSLSIKEMQETISRLEAKFNAQYKGMELDNAPIIKRLKRSRTNPFMYPIEKTDWEELRTAIEERYPAFYMHMHNGKRINDTEYQVCLLVKAGFTPSDIDILLGRNEYAATTRKRLLKKIFDKEGSGKDFDKMVQELT
ncbi:MAG: hypothetical protein J6L60_03015 [Bacteroidaceae bacterium]|nr:hypothetical protein [Bacteroidaceae bacterium]